MPLATMVACNEEGNGNSGMSNGNEGGGQATAARAMVTATATMWAMVTAARWVGDKEGKGKGSKDNSVGDKVGGQAMAMATRGQ
jgi:hypothetical protein